MDAGFEQLTLRLRLIESTYINRNSEHDDNLIQRLKAINSRVATIEKEYPEVRVPIDALEKTFPLVLTKMGSLKGLLDKANVVQIKREIIEQHIKVLQSMTSSHDVINGKDFANAEHFRNLLESVIITASSLQHSIKKQTAEIDEILQLYEESATYISKTIESWDIRLKHGRL